MMGQHKFELIKEEEGGGGKSNLKVHLEEMEGLRGWEGDELRR